MPISITSYLFLSNAFSTDRAERSEISCSPERPPNNTARLSFANACLRPPCSRSRSFPLPDLLDLQLQLNPELIGHPPAGKLEHPPYPRRPGLAPVEEEVGVQGADPRLPPPFSLQPGGFNQPAGIVAGGVLEHRAPTGAAGLSPLAILGQLRHPFLHRLLIAGLQPEDRRQHHRLARVALEPAVAGRELQAFGRPGLDSLPSRQQIGRHQLIG